MRDTTSTIRRDERGTVMVVLLVLLVGVAGFAQASLVRSMAEQKKAAKRLLSRQVQVVADGQMEVARNMVNASPYDIFLQNQVLINALQAPNQVIPGTQVRVERVGTSHYFSLETLAGRHGISKSADAVVRQVSPSSAFNLFVIDHPVGVSGRPRGAIHTNRYIDFFFPGGQYRDSITASEGFNFMAGATQANTTFGGSVNPNAAASNLLQGVDFAALQSEADILAVPENHDVYITLEGNIGRAQLYSLPYTEYVLDTRQRQRLIGYTTETYIVQEPIYDTVTYTWDEEILVPVNYEVTITEPVYAYRDVEVTYTDPVYESRLVEYTVSVPVYGTRTATRQVEKQVWVSYAEMEVTDQTSGGTVATTGNLDGYWKTVTETETYEETYVTGYTNEVRTRTETVKVGETTRVVTESERYIASYTTRTETRTRWEVDRIETRTGTREEIVGYQDVVKTRDVPVYETYLEEYTRKIYHGREFVGEEVFPMGGTVYFGGTVQSIKGRINGRLSLIANGVVEITDSIQYVDDEGDTRMLNGVDPTKPYIENPDYNGDSLLAILARQDIEYSKESPKEVEINASLMSVEGSVVYERLKVSEDGTSVSTQFSNSDVYYDRLVKNSLRRLGGIVSRRRPVATYIDETGVIGAGFRQGVSMMDQNLLLSAGTNAPPPFTFESSTPTWIMTTSGSRLGSIQ